MSQEHLDERQAQNPPDNQPPYEAAHAGTVPGQIGAESGQRGTAPVPPSQQYMPPVPPTQQASQSQQPRKSRGWIVAVVIGIVLLFMLVAGMWSCSSAIASLGGSTFDDSADMLTGEAVGVITLDGEIAYDGTTCSPDGLKAQLDVAAENDNIVAVVLRVNSGGGVATAGEEMATYVREFREKTNKPVVVSSAATNASAAYEISSQADYIFVAQSTAIGAIGTAMQIVDYSDLMKMLGISIENITSSDSKDSSYGTRELTKKEREYYQDMVNKINNVFIQNVVEGRGMTQDEVKKLATGMPFTGGDAVKNGLADAIGTEEDAVQKAAELAGITTSNTVDLEPNKSAEWEELLDLMSESNSKSISADELAKALKELERDDSLAH